MEFIAAFSNEVMEPLVEAQSDGPHRSEVTAN